MAIINSTPNTVITGTANADEIYNSGATVTIDAEAGNDVIINAIEYVYSEELEDMVFVYGSNSSIVGGDGNDNISNAVNNDVTINGGNGNDTISNEGSNSSIAGGAGNDVIINAVSSGTTLYGITFDDTILGDNVTIDGSLGDDTIVIANATSVAAEVFIEYADGDGNDSVHGYSSDTTTIQLASGLSTTSVQSGANLIINVEGDSNGSITLVDYGDSDTNVNTANANIDLSSAGDSIGVFVVDGSVDIDSDTFYTATFKTTDETLSTDLLVGNVDSDHVYVARDGTGRQSIHSSSDWNVTTTSNNDTISNDGDNSTLNAGNGDDSITNHGDSSTVNAGDGDDYINNYGANALINAGLGDDAIDNSAANSTLNAGDGYDNIDNSSLGSNVYIDAGSEDDQIINDGDNVTIASGDGGAM